MTDPAWKVVPAASGRFGDGVRLMVTVTSPSSVVILPPLVLAEPSGYPVGVKIEWPSLRFAEDADATGVP